MFLEAVLDWDLDCFANRSLKQADFRAGIDLCIAVDEQLSKPQRSFEAYS